MRAPAVGVMSAVDSVGKGCRLPGFGPGLNWNREPGTI